MAGFTDPHPIHSTFRSACLGSSTAFVHRLYESLASGLDLASSFSCAEFYLRSIENSPDSLEEPCRYDILPGTLVSAFDHVMTILSTFSELLFSPAPAFPATKAS